jgi:DNA-binding CsgD family transcriptional regulator
MASNDTAEILAKLDMLIRLQALSMVSRFESSKEKIHFLATAGMQPKEIADLLQTSPNTVSVTLSKSRKGKKSGTAD